MYLVKSWEDVVSELDLCDGGGPGLRQADPEPGDALLAKWCVENSVFSVFVLKTHGATEHTSEGHVLPEYASGGVFVKGDVHGAGHRLQKGHLVGLACRKDRVPCT